jgi:hypothetical protein
MSAVYLFQRSNSPDLSVIRNPIIIAGLLVIGLIFCGLLAWFGFRIYRKRAVAKRESKMGAAFLSVKGVVHEDGNPSVYIHSIVIKTILTMCLTPPFFQGCPTGLRDKFRRNPFSLQ